MFISGSNKFNIKDGEDFFWRNFQLLLEKKSFYNCKYKRYNIDFFKTLSREKFNIVQDKSFLLLDEKGIFFAFIGAEIENEKGENQISCFGMPSITLELDELSISQQKYIKKEIDDLIYNLKDKLILIDFYNDSKFSVSFNHIIFNYKCKLNYNYSRFIDLNPDIKELKSKVRKSYKSLINMGEKEMDIKIYSHKNINLEVIDKFRSLHIREAGRETRSKDSWISQYHSVLHNQAFIVSADINEELVSSGYFFMGRSHCFYASSASRRDLFEKPLFHSLLWKAIQYSKSIGIKVFETGAQYPKFMDKNITSKEFTIAKFKSGFGGSSKLNIILDLDKKYNLGL